MRARVLYGVRFARASQIRGHEVPRAVDLNDVPIRCVREGDCDFAGLAAERDGRDLNA